MEFLSLEYKIKLKNYNPPTRLKYCFLTYPPTDLKMKLLLTAKLVEEKVKRKNKIQSYFGMYFVNKLYFMCVTNLQKELNYHIFYFIHTV